MTYSTIIKKFDEARAEIHVEFNCADQQGRALGAYIVSGVHEFALQTEGRPAYGYDMAPGRYFWFAPQSSRGGRAFGPIQSRRYFKTEAERTVAIEKYLAAALKRAVKKSAGGQS